MPTKLSCHWQRTHPSQLDDQWLNAWRPLHIKIITVADNDVPGLDTALRYIHPQGRVIVRHHPVSENFGKRGFTDRAQAREMGRAHAAILGNLWSIIRGRYNVAPEQLLWTGLNEPNVWGSEPPELTATYYAEFTRRMHAQGLSVMVLNFGVGWPGNDGVRDAPPIWQPYEEVRQELRPGDVLGLHEYWPVAGPQYAYRWLAGRFEQCPWREVQIIIGECGLDDAVAPGVTAAGTLEWEIDAYIEFVTQRHTASDVSAQALAHFGWHMLNPNADVAARRYLDMLAWYDAKLASDSRILSAMPFTYDFAHPWATFDIRVAPFMRLFLEYVQTVGGVQGPQLVSLKQPIRVFMPDGTVKTIELEEYLRGVVPSEVPATWPAEAVKAQAVAARVYALAAIRNPRHADKGADICTTQHCQVYNAARIHPASDAAVATTAGQVLLYQGQPIVAYFSAACGGRTRSNTEAFGGTALPYLQPVDCPCGRQRQGHGVGLCQWGAKALADQGWDYRRILKHYYAGVRLSDEADQADTEIRQAIRKAAETIRQGLSQLEQLV